MTCEKGDKPTVIYTFANGSEKRYQSSFSPIDVTTRTAPIEASSNYNPQGCQITFAAPQGQFGTVTLTVVDYQINKLFFSDFDSDNGYYLSFIPCGFTYNAIDSPCSDYKRKVAGCKTNTIKMTNGQISSIDPNVKCPSPNTGRCAIQVYSSGQLLFQDQGDCPVNYKVQCGKCPDGQCECASPIYPGYCCLDCKATADQIKQVVTEVNLLNLQDIPTTLT